MPFISNKYEFAPLLTMEEKAVDFQFITDEQSRYDLAKYLIACEKGDHFDREKKCKKEGYDFGHVKVKSYRI